MFLEKAPAGNVYEQPNVSSITSCIPKSTTPLIAVKLLEGTLWQHRRLASLVTWLPMPFSAC